MTAMGHQPLMAMNRDLNTSAVDVQVTVIEIAEQPLALAKCPYGSGLCEDMQYGRKK